VREGKDVTPEQPGQPVRIFVSYARVDGAYRSELAAHLAVLRDLQLIADPRAQIADWHDGDVVPGGHWDREIDIVTTVHGADSRYLPDLLDGLAAVLIDTGERSAADRCRARAAKIRAKRTRDVAAKQRLRVARPFRRGRRRQARRS
jgi:hypothetical protein